MQRKIMKMHKDADQNVKDAYNMKITKDDCFVDTKNVVIVGQKKKK